MKYFKMTKKNFEQTYDKYFQDYIKYEKERQALLRIMRCDGIGDKLDEKSKGIICSRIAELSKILDDLNEALGDMEVMKKVIV